MNAGNLLYLSRKDVETVGLPMSRIVAALDEMFKEKGEGRVEMPPKPGIHTRKDAFIHAMPAYIRSLEAAGVKWVSGYPENQAKGLPYISGLLMLNEGNRDGKQVISREWANRIVSVVTPLEEMNPIGRRDGYFGYGYMWWLWDGPKAVGPFEGAYTARGAIGQWITVLPAIDLVIAHKTNSVYGRTTSWESYERLIELLFEAHGVEMEGPYPWR